MSLITACSFGLAAPCWLRSTHRARGWALGVALLVWAAVMTGLSYELAALQKTCCQLERTVRSVTLTLRTGPGCATLRHRPRNGPLEHLP